MRCAGRPPGPPRGPRRRRRGGGPRPAGRWGSLPGADPGRSRTISSAIPWSASSAASGLLTSWATPATSVPMAASREESASWAWSARASVTSTRVTSRFSPDRDAGDEHGAHGSPPPVVTRYSAGAISPPDSAAASVSPRSSDSRHLPAVVLVRIDAEEPVVQGGDVLQRVAEDLGEAVVDGDDPSLRIVEGDRDGEVADQLPEVLLAGPEAPPRTPLLSVTSRTTDTEPMIRPSRSFTGDGADPPVAKLSGRRECGPAPPRRPRPRRAGRGAEAPPRPGAGSRRPGTPPASGPAPRRRRRPPTTHPELGECRGVGQHEAPLPVVREPDLVADAREQRREEIPLPLDLVVQVRDPSSRLLPLGDVPDDGPHRGGMALLPRQERSASSTGKTVPSLAPVLLLVDLGVAPGRTCSETTFASAACQRSG